jgi:hypothetical protein
MAKRKEDLAKKLGGGGTTPPGWKSQIAPGGPAEPAKAEPQPSPSYQRKTYLITPDMVQRIKDTAAHYRVGQNELVRFLLGQALDQLDAGRLELPLEETYRIKE